MSDSTSTHDYAAMIEKRYANLDPQTREATLGALSRGLTTAYNFDQEASAIPTPLAIGGRMAELGLSRMDTNAIITRAEVVADWAAMATCVTSVGEEQPKLAREAQQSLAGADWMKTGDLTIGETARRNRAWDALERFAEKSAPMASVMWDAYPGRAGQAAKPEWYVQREERAGLVGGINPEAPAASVSTLIGVSIPKGEIKMAGPTETQNKERELMGELTPAERQTLNSPGYDPMTIGDRVGDKTMVENDIIKSMGITQERREAARATALGNRQQTSDQRVAAAEQSKSAAAEL